MTEHKVGLIGFGTIGAGVAKILLGKEQSIASAAGETIKLARICDKDLVSDRGVSVPDGVLTDDVNTIFNDPSIEVVIELIGGLEPARTFVLKAMESGKDIVTANKALLANHGPELFEKARSLGRTIAFEAAVGGGIPILSSIMTSLQANKIESVQAILNGTCNYILSQMEDQGTDYSTAVKKAQELGYAEANPSMDVDGTDTVQKLTILAQMAFGAKLNWKDVSRQGIDSIDAIDIGFAKAFSYRIRLIANVKRTETGLELKVAPTLVPERSPLAQVKNAFNAVQIVGDFVGPVFYQGYGAGQRPTASAVCSDVIDTVLGRTAITFKAMNLWGANRPSTVVLDSDQVCSRYYLRVQVEDKPGVMSEVSGVLAKHGISIASIIQRAEEDEGEQLVYLILMTHRTLEGKLEAAIDEIDALSCVRAETISLDVD